MNNQRSLHSVLGTIGSVDVQTVGSFADKTVFSKTAEEKSLLKRMKHTSKFNNKTIKHFKVL